MEIVIRQRCRDAVAIAVSRGDTLKLENRWGSTSDEGSPTGIRRARTIQDILQRLATCRPGTAKKFQYVVGVLSAGGVRHGVVVERGREEGALTVRGSDVYWNNSLLRKTASCRRPRNRSGRRCCQCHLISVRPLPLPSSAQGTSRFGFCGPDRLRSKAADWRLCRVNSSLLLIEPLLSSCLMLLCPTRIPFASLLTR